MADSDSQTQRNVLLTYILNNAANKMPMKFVDMAELFGKQTKVLLTLLPLVATALKKDYGIILQEVPNQKSGRKVICFADDTAASVLEFDEEQKRHTTLLFLILSYIFMNNDSVYEHQLEDYLEGLDILYDEEHDYFGPNIKKLITETFVKQLYLKKTKSDSEFDTETKYLLSWGYRAHMEFRKMDVLNATAKIMGKSAKFFQAQYIDACAAEQCEEDNE